MTTVLQSDSSTAREEIAGADGIVLVDFTAAWCPPCRQLSPVLDQLAREATDLRVLKVDVDASPELASSYQVMSMPTLIFFAEGRELRRLVGARGIAALREELEQVRAAARSESSR
jgi:thioredoxin 1